MTDATDTTTPAAVGVPSPPDDGPVSGEVERVARAISAAARAAALQAAPSPPEPDSGAVERGAEEAWRAWYQGEEPIKDDGEWAPWLAAFRAGHAAALAAAPSPPEPDSGAASHPTIDGRPILLGDRLVSTVEVDCVHDPCYDGCPIHVDAEFRVVFVTGDVVQGDDGEEYAVADCRRVDAALAAAPSPPPEAAAPAWDLLREIADGFCADEADFAKRCFETYPHRPAEWCPACAAEVFLAAVAAEGVAAGDTDGEEVERHG